MGPKQPEPPWMPAARAGGPLTSTNTAQGWVVALMPSRLNGGCAIASTAASTTGKCCGRQPAMTALIAIACTVASPCRGASTPKISSGSRLDAATIASTRSGVGGINGRPSDHPRRMHSWAKSNGSLGSAKDSAGRPLVAISRPRRSTQSPVDRRRRHRFGRERARDVDHRVDGAQSADPAPAVHAVRLRAVTDQ